MSPAHVFEPTYERLKSALLTGAWSQSEKLEAQRIADDFGVSMTPVRDSLNRLVGENLAEFNPGEGYRVPQLTEKLLRNMLDLRLLLIEQALHTGDPQSWPKPRKPKLSTYAERAETVLSELARWSGNTVLSDTVSGLNDRLALARRLEPELFPSAHDEIEHIARLATERNNRLLSAIATYHEARRSSASGLIDLLGSWRPRTIK